MIKTYKKQINKKKWTTKSKETAFHGAKCLTLQFSVW